MISKEMLTAPLDPSFSAESMEGKINLLADNLVQLYNIHASIRAVKIKHAPTPWLIADIRTLIDRKDVDPRRPTPCL